MPDRGEKKKKTLSTRAAYFHFAVVVILSKLTTSYLSFCDIHVARKSLTSFFCLSIIIQVWEMETGQLVYQVTEAHGPSTEITAMTVDSTGYRLATGAYNGK